MNLTHVNDEDNEEIFRVVTELQENLSGGFRDDTLWDRTVNIQKACLEALRGGTDNLELVATLEPQVQLTTEEFLTKYKLKDV